MTPARYQLDGQPLNAKRVGLEHGWSPKLIAKAMAESSPPTTLAELRAWMVRRLSVPRETKRQPGRGARRWNNCTMDLQALNKTGTAGSD